MTNTTANSQIDDASQKQSVWQHMQRVVRAIAFGVYRVIADIFGGFTFLARHGFALVGLAIVLLLAYLLSDPEMVVEREKQLFGWLLQRQQVPDSDIPELKSGYRSVSIPADPQAASRSTTVDFEALQPEQQKVVSWLSRKYRIAPEPLAALVSEAYDLGERTKIDPLLIMAVMAIESRFNPYAQSSVGAQGLMQVMTTVHHDKYSHFGGDDAAFDPVTNMRVGVKILHEAIALSGSVEGGLRRYVGATSVYTEGGYGKKVLAEYTRLYAVAQGQTVAFNAKLPRRKPSVRGLPKLTIRADNEVVGEP